MNKRLGAKVEMWRTVRDLRNNALYAGLIAGVTGVAAAFTALEGHIDQMEALDLSRAGAAAVAGPAKNVARDLLTTTALVVDGIFTARAVETNDDLLLAQVNKERTDLRKMRDQELRTHVQFLQGLIVTPIPAPLSALGLTTALVTQLETRFDTFTTLATLPESKTAQESTFVALMVTQEDAGDKLLDLTLDKLMRQFSETNLEFYTAYREARVINDPATQPEEDSEEPPPPPPPPES